MKEFFKGWRRKIGIVTLLMACVSAGGWVRSTSFDDLIDYVRDKRTAFFVHSVDQYLFFVWLHDGNHSFGSTIGSVPLSDSHDLLVIPRLRNAGWKCCGFAIGDTKNNPDDPNTNIAFCLVPYWSIVTPLTLISLWLLRTNPRKSTPKKIAEPIPAEGK